MDIGALMQAFSGKSMAASTNGTMESATLSEIWQPSGEMTAGQDNASFYEAIRQILGETDGGLNPVDSDRHCSQAASNDAAHVISLLEGVRDRGLGERQAVEDGGSGPETAEELLNLLNGPTSELETTIFSESDNPAENDSQLLALLADKNAVMEPMGTESDNPAKMEPTGTGSDKQAENHPQPLTPLDGKNSAMNPAVSESDTAHNDELPTDAKVTQAVPTSDNRQPFDAAAAQDVQKTIDHSKMASTDNRPASTVAVLGEDGFSKSPDGKRMVVQQQDPNAEMGRSRSGSIPPNPMPAESTDKTQPATVATPKELSPSAILSDASVLPGGRNKIEKDGPLRQETDGIHVHGKKNADNALVQHLTSKSNTQGGGQETDQSSSDADQMTKQTLEGRDLQKDPLNTVAAEDKLSTATESKQKGARPHQAVAAEPAKDTPLEAAKTNDTASDPVKFVVSGDSAVDKTQSTSGTPPEHPKPVSENTAFQKTVMDQIVEKVTFRSSSDRSEMQIQLKPDTLGNVRMRVVSENQQLVVQMVADKSEAKEIIESQLHHLKAELDKQGLTVGKIEVMISAGNDQQDSRNQFQQMFKNQSDGNGKRHSGGKHDGSPSRQQPGDQEESKSAGDGINYFV